MRRSEIEENTILLSITGSQAYGLATPESDTDYKGVFVASKPYYSGFRTIEQKDSGWHEDSTLPYYSVIDGETDCTVYEIRKYIRLALNANPNILEMLWLPEDKYVFLSSLGRKLVDNREIFLSKKVKYSLTGYAYSQLKRIESHRGWLLNPQKEPPSLPNEWQPLSKSDTNTFLEFLYILTKDRLEYLETLDEIRKLYNLIDLKQVITSGNFTENPELLSYSSHITRGSKDFATLLHKTHLYNKQLKEWKDYQSWKLNRNPRRAAIEAKCGYDGKMASQAVRLLTMGLEALEKHTLKVDRTGIDAEFLLAIKQGRVSYEVLMSLCEDLFSNLELRYQESTLKHKPDFARAEELCIELVEEFRSKT